MSNNGKFIVMSWTIWNIRKIFIHVSELCFCFKLLIVIVKILSGWDFTSLGTWRQNWLSLSNQADEISKKNHLVCSLLKSPF